MGPVPAPEIGPNEIPEPVDGTIILNQDQAARLTRTMITLINYLQVSWARCHAPKDAPEEAPAAP